MNTLLLPEHPLVVLPTLAKLIGLEEAVALQQIHYWLQKAEKQIDGVPWVYNTYEQWAEQMPWLSPRSAGNLFRKLEQEGYIRTEQRSGGTDRTKWYTINYDKLEGSRPSSESGLSHATKNGNMDATKSEPSYISQRLPTETTTPPAASQLSPKLMPEEYPAWAEGFSRIEGLSPQTLADLVDIGCDHSPTPAIGCVLGFVEHWRLNSGKTKPNWPNRWRNWLNNEHKILPFSEKPTPDRERARQGMVTLE